MCQLSALGGGWHILFPILISMKHLLFIIATISLCIFSSCGKSKSTDADIAATRNDSTTLRLSLMPTVGTLPIYYAASAGIYETLGLNLQLTTYFSQFDCDTALLGTAADGISSDLVRTHYYEKRGEKLHKVIALEGSRALVANGKLRMRSAAKMTDRMIAVARHSAADYFSKEALAAVNLPYDAAFRPQINDLYRRVSMLDAGQIDAVMLPEPQTSLAVHQGNKKLYDGTAANVRLDCIILNDKAIKNPTTAEKLRLLREGYNRAIETLNAQGASACRELLKSTYRLPDAVIDSLKLPSYRPAATSGKSDEEKAAAFFF